MENAMTKPTLVPRTSLEHPSCARQPPTAASPPAMRARAAKQQPALAWGLSPWQKQFLGLLVQMPGEEQSPLKQGSAMETLSCSLHGLGELGALATQIGVGDGSKKDRQKDAAPAGGVREGGELQSTGAGDAETARSHATISGEVPGMSLGQTAPEQMHTSATSLRYGFTALPSVTALMCPWPQGPAPKSQQEP